MQHAFASRWIRYFVPNIGTLILMALMLFAYRVSAAPGSPPTAPDAIPSTISYQGMLNDAAGQSINGNTGITFRLYNAPTGATTSALWTEAHTGANAVPVSNGLFNVQLGSLNPIPASVWSNANVYLGVQVGNDAEMAPRETIGDVPSAKVAMSVLDGAIGTGQIADNAITTAKIADGAINSAKVQDGSITQTDAPSLLRSTVSNQRIETGEVYFDNQQTGWRNLRVNFAQSFSSAPTVLITTWGKAAPVEIEYWSKAGVHSVDTTGFTLKAYSESTSYGVAFFWVAIGN